MCHLVLGAAREAKMKRDKTKENLGQDHVIAKRLDKELTTVKELDLEEARELTGSDVLCQASKHTSISRNCMCYRDC